MKRNNELPHHIVVVEQHDITDELGRYRGTEELAIWESCDFRVHPAASFREYLAQRYPSLNFDFDDGFDWDEQYDTDYSQYVLYLDEPHKHWCLLATYTRTKNEEEEEA